jgi:sugar phosphate isomerase/epimerase
MIRFGNALTWNWVGFLGVDFHKALDEIALTGWEGIEISTGPMEYYLQQQEELKKLLSLHRLKMTTFYSHLHLIDEDHARQDMESVRGKLLLHKLLGADVVLIDGGFKSPDGVKKEECETAVENIKRICHMVTSQKLKPTWHIHWGTIFDDRELFEYMMEETAGEGLYFCPDTAQLYMSGMDPYEIMEKYKDRISYVHFKDLVLNRPVNRYKKITKDIDPANNTLYPLATAGRYKYQTESFRDTGAFHINSGYRVTEIARGIIDFKPIVKLLQDTAYSGWVVVDQDYTGYRNMESMDVNLRNLKYLFGKEG